MGLHGLELGHLDDGWDHHLDNLCLRLALAGLPEPGVEAVTADIGGPTITSKSIKSFARTARKRMRIDGSGYRRDYLRVLAQRVEVDARIMGSKSELLRTLVAASSAKTPGFGAPSSVPKWRTRHDSNV